MSDDFKVMLAKEYDPKRVQSWKEMYVQPKLDGVRVLVNVSGKKVSFFSRNGRELEMFAHLKKKFIALRDRCVQLDGSSLKNAMFDGEMTAPTFADVSGAIHRKDYIAAECVYAAFAVMPFKLFQKGIDKEQQFSRIELLDEAVPKPVNDDVALITVPPVTRVLDDKQVWKAHKAFRKDGYEGTMVKNLLVPWTACRSYDWMKIKDEVTHDVKVVDMKEGKGKYVGMCGALICDHNGVKVRVAGMDDSLRQQFWEKPKSIIGHMIEVKAQEETAAGSLRHPRFIRMRPDKE